jgi:hypothetical protein
VHIALGQNTFIKLLTPSVKLGCPVMEIMPAGVLDCEETMAALEALAVCT